MMDLDERCARCVLVMEHDMLTEAFDEWCGTDEKHAMEDIAYLQGIHDFVHNAIEKLLEVDNGEGE